MKLDQYNEVDDIDRAVTLHFNPRALMPQRKRRDPVTVASLGDVPVVGPDLAAAQDATAAALRVVGAFFRTPSHWYE
jgi:hypothetical protein